MITPAPKLANVFECTGCLACVASCKFSALSKTMGEDGHIYVKIDSDKCVGCRQCEKVCARSREFAGNNDIQLSTPYSVWANDVQLRQRSTSGGLAAAAGTWIIKNGGSVSGVAFDGRRAAHVMVSNLSGLASMQGSKYVYSDMLDAYKAIEDKLPSGMVLFTGTGCQAAGVLSFFESHPNRDNLYIMDIICGGVPSDLLMQVYFESNPRVSSISSFRSKRKYELKGIEGDKEVVLPSSALPISGFCAEQTMRYSCYDCPYSFAHRCSDITVGDLWGNSAPSGERDKGVSLAVVHTSKGRHLLESLDVTKDSVKWDCFLPSNPRLVFGKSPVTVLRRRLEYNHKHLDPASFSRVYSLSSSVKQPLEFFVRLLVYIRRRYYRLLSRKCIKAILK